MACFIDHVLTITQGAAFGMACWNDESEVNMIVTLLTTLTESCRCAYTQLSSHFHNVHSVAKFECTPAPPDHLKVGWCCVLCIHSICINRASSRCGRL